MPTKDSRPPTNMRRYRRLSERNMLIAVIAVLVLVGTGLIALIYGAGAGVTSLACLLFGAGTILILWLLLSLIERWLGDD